MNISSRSAIHYATHKDFVSIRVMPAMLGAPLSYPIGNFVPYRIKKSDRMRARAKRNMSQATALGARMCSDSVKNISAYADQNHAPGLTDAST